MQAWDVAFEALVSACEGYAAQVRTKRNCG